MKKSRKKGRKKGLERKKRRVKISELMKEDASHDEGRSQLGCFLIGIGRLKFTYNINSSVFWFFDYVGSKTKIELDNKLL